MNIRKTLLSIILLFTVVGCSMSGSFESDKDTPSGASLKEVSMGYSALRISLPVFVAQENGYFEQYAYN